MVSLDWEEGIFRGIQKLFRVAKSATESASNHAVSLDLVETHCLTVAQLIAGMPLHLRAAEDLGGIRNQVLLLPPYIDLAPCDLINQRIYFVRTVLNATMVQLTQGVANPLFGLEGRLRYLDLVHRARKQLENQFETFKTLHETCLSVEIRSRPSCEHRSTLAQDFEHLRLDLAQGQDFHLPKALAQFAAHDEPSDLTPGFFLWGETLTAGETRLAAMAEKEMPHQTQSEDGFEVTAPPKDYVSLTCLEQIDDIPPLPLHTFEKTETLETYKGGMRQVDGEDELEEHLEALNELDLREVIRGGSDTRGFYKADIDLETQIPDCHHRLPEEKGITYPEWFFKTRAYRQHWVTVYPTTVMRRDAATAQAIIRNQRHQIRALKNRIIAYRTRDARLNRQTQGDDIDLEAVVTAHADRVAGLDPGEKLYEALRKPVRNTAVTLLFDISLSCGSWVNGRRILDVTRETVLVLGEVAATLGDQFRILCFASNTRNHCRVFEVKNWREPWHQAKNKVCGIEPQGYTRMGPALRHAIAGFDNISAKRRGLLVITDGKPTDYDRYEGIYGRQDICMAISEGKAKGVHTHALALDPKARQSLPSMFGPGGWQVLRTLSDLTEAAVKAYAHFHKP